MYDVFISYSRAGSGTEATNLAEALTAQGLSVFLDTREIPLGSTFPEELAEGVLQSRLMVVFTDATYFERYWCVCEYQLGISVYRKAVSESPANSSAAYIDEHVSHIVIALPDKEELDAVIPYLPPPVAQKSWPPREDTAALVSLVQDRLSTVSSTIGERLEGFDDNALARLLDGGAIPSASPIRGIPSYLQHVPESLGSRFVGRDDVLWKIFNALETSAVAGESTQCILSGLGGVGKTQIAAEYARRYGANYYPGGLFWVNADSNEADLVDQLHTVSKALDSATLPLNEMGASTDERYHALALRLVEHFSTRSSDSPVLWIIDNIPEPSAGKKMRPIKYWCPAAQYVRVLGTTRRSAIRSGTRIEINTLTSNAAVELLTDGDVDQASLPPDEWEEIARCVGYLLLALQILNTSLALQFTTPQTVLRKVRGIEPASYLNEEMEALQEEIEEDYLRGVVETFRVSYDRLAQDEEACQALQLLSYLSPIPLPEALLNTTISGRLLGKLANRSWIHSSTSEHTGRLWTVHRIVSSFVRTQIPDPIRMLGRIAGWLQAAFEAELDPDVLRKCAPHFIRLYNLAVQYLPTYDDHTREIVVRIARCGHIAASYKLSERELDGIRYLAARLVHWAGADNELIAHLNDLYETRGSAVSKHIPHVLQVFTQSEAAAHLFARLLKDENEETRRQTMIYVGRSKRADILAEPFLNAILSTPEAGARKHSIMSWAGMFDPRSAVLGAELNHLLEMLDGGHPLEREVAAEAAGRLFFEFKDTIATDTFTSIEFALELLNRIPAVPEEEVALQLAGSLGQLERDDVYERLIEMLKEAAAPDDQLRMLKCAAHYLRIRNNPPAPNIEVEWNEEGGVSFHAKDGTFFPSRKQRPEMYKPLAEFIIHTAPELLAPGIDILCRQDLGKYGVVLVAQDLLEAGAFQRVTDVAEAVMERVPGFSSPYWWRAQAHEAEGRVQEAIADYGVVLSLTPEFIDANYQRALLYQQQGRIEEAIADYSRVMEVETNNADHYGYRGYLYSLIGDNEKALIDYEKSIELNPEDTHSLYSKALIHYNGRAYEPAIETLDRLLTIEPTHRDALYIKSVSHLHLGNWADSITSISNALLLDQDQPEYLYIRAAARMKAGLAQDALKDIQRSIELSPGVEKYLELKRQLEMHTKT